MHRCMASDPPQGIVHCDLCPRNVLLSSLTGEDVEVKVRCHCCSSHTHHERIRWLTLG